MFPLDAWRLNRMLLTFPQQEPFCAHIPSAVVADLSGVPLIFNVTENNEPCRSSLYTFALFVFCAIRDRLSVCLPFCHFSPHLGLMARPLSDICSRAYALQAYNKKLVTLSYTTLIFFPNTLI